MDKKKRIPNWVFWAIIIFCVGFLIILTAYISAQGKSCIEDPFSYSADKISKAIGDMPVFCSCQSPSLSEPYLFSSTSSNETKK